MVQPGLHSANQSMQGFWGQNEEWGPNIYLAGYLSHYFILRLMLWSIIYGFDLLFLVELTPSGSVGAGILSIRLLDRITLWDDIRISIYPQERLQVEQLHNVLNFI